MPEVRYDAAEQWERFGQRDPYFGVFSSERHHREALDRRTLDEFFASGAAHVAQVLEWVRAEAGSDFSAGAVLDHGCGVGRVTIPFAAVAERVVGVDVSPSMLAEARRNCDARGIANVELRGADELWTLRPQQAVQAGEDAHMLLRELERGEIQLAGAQALVDVAGEGEGGLHAALGALGVEVLEALDVEVRELRRDGHQLHQVRARELARDRGEFGGVLGEAGARGRRVRDRLQVERLGGGEDEQHQNNTRGFMIRFGSSAARTARIASTSAGCL